MNAEVDLRGALVWIDGEMLGACAVSITESVISFTPESGAKGFTASMSRLAVHALSNGRNENGARWTSADGEDDRDDGERENGDDGLGACLYMQLETEASDGEAGDEFTPFMEVRIVLKSTCDGRGDGGELEEVFAKVTACVEAAEAARGDDGDGAGGSGAAAMMMMMMNMMAGKEGGGEWNGEEGNQDCDERIAERLDGLLVSPTDDVHDAARFEDAEEDQEEADRNGS